MTKRTKPMPAFQTSRSIHEASEADVNQNIDAFVDPKTTTDAATKSPSKTEQVLALLRRNDGATLDQLVAATGWLPHTTRAMLTGQRKQGYVITSTKTDGPRVYRVVAVPGDVA